MPRITLAVAQGGYFIEPQDDPESSLYVSTDYDYPGVASTFGWSVREVPGTIGRFTCTHDGTDGTIDCPACGITASRFIAEARSYLDEHIGATADDPGYFSGD